MPRLPPADKLPLAVRKDIRDNWDHKKEELEQKLSATMGEAWTINVDPKALYPYGEENSWARTSTGDMIYRYFSGAEEKLRYFIERVGPEAKDEINSIVHAHTITIDFAENKKVYYCGCEVSNAGELVILFSEGNLGTNIDDAVNQSNLAKALNEAAVNPDTAKPMSYYTRAGITEEYTPNIPAIQEKINKLLGKDITLDPNFEGIYEKLKASSDVPSEWEQNTGRIVRYYFEGLVDYLEREKFGEDEMLQEGLVEALENSTVSVRVLDKISRYYNEPVLEDGTLYLQTTPSNWGTNASQIADKLIDLL